MYHILYDLESRFQSLEEVQNYIQDITFTPDIPRTAMQNEDRDTPRISVAPTIEDCITAIGSYGMFRRCLDANPHTKSYENNNEVYPIVICEFPNEIPENPYITPTPEQVPDVSDTHEKWLLQPAKPARTSIAWLDAHSILLDTKRLKEPCTHVTFVQDIKNKDHPWLNKKGHPLDCSDMGGEIWTDNETTEIVSIDAMTNLYWDPCSKTGYVFPIPASNKYAICHMAQHMERGLVLTGETYRTAINRLCRFTGFKDREGRLLFEYDTVHQTHADKTTHGSIVYENGQPCILLYGAKKPPMPCHTLETDETETILTEIELPADTRRRSI